MSEKCCKCRKHEPQYCTECWGSERGVVIVPSTSAPTPEFGKQAGGLPRKKPGCSECGHHRLHDGQVLTAYCDRCFRLANDQKEPSDPDDYTCPACGTEHNGGWLFDYCDQCQLAAKKERKRIAQIVQDAAAAGPTAGPGARMWVEATIWIARRIENESGD